MNILFIASVNNPFHATNGGTQRSALLLNALSQIANVDVISFCTEDVLSSESYNIIHQEIWVNPEKDGRRKKFRRLLTPWKPDTIYVVDKHKEQVVDDAVAAKKYDYIVIRYMPMAIECGLWKYEDILVIDIDDNPIDRVLADAVAAKSLRNKVYLRLYARSLEIALDRVQKNTRLVYVSNPDDCNGKAIYLPNVPFYSVGEKSTKIEIPNRMVFVGDLGYWANIQGITYFLDMIYPKIQKVIPEIELHLVGRIWNEELKTQWEKNKGVVVTGFVPCLVDEYAEAQVAVIPIYYGAGTCIKVLEAMQMKKVCVTTWKGFRGYDKVFEIGKDCIVVNSDEEFASQIINLLQDDKLRESITESAYTKQQTYYTQSAFNKVIADNIK